jgi:hypothetical protein
MIVAKSINLYKIFYIYYIYFFHSSIVSKCSYRIVMLAALNTRRLKIRPDILYYKRRLKERLLI